MKQIAYTSLALIPLLAGCASSSLGPPAEPEAKQVRDVSALQAQIRKLGRRVSVLNRQVKSQTAQTSGAVSERASELDEIRTRLAELEAAAAPDESQPTVASLAEQLAELSRQLEAQAVLQPQRAAAVTDEITALKKRLDELAAAQDSAARGPATRQAITDLAARVTRLASRIDALSNKPPRVAAETTRSLEQLIDRLGKLEAAQRAAATRTATADLEKSVADLNARLARLSRRIEQRERTAGTNQATTRSLRESLARLEAAQKKDGGELRKMQSDLEKDRTLVIDYLDDLDKRLGDLEKSVAAPDTPPAPAAPTPQPAPAPPPSPAKPQ